MNLRHIAAATTLLTVAFAAPALAQKGADSLKNHSTDTISRETPHWHFEGTISTVNPDAHQVTIAADSIPMQYGGKTTLPYDVPPKMGMAQFKEGARVNADLVVRDNRSRVENLEFGPTKKAMGGKKDPHAGMKMGARQGTPKDTGHAGIQVDKTANDRGAPTKP